MNAKREAADTIVRRIATDLQALARTETRGSVRITGLGWIVWSAEPLPVFDRIVLRVVVHP